MDKSEDKIITISDDIAVGPLLAGIVLGFSVLSGRLPWEVLLIVFLWSLGNSITVKWRKLLQKNNQGKLKP